MENLTEFFTNHAVLSQNWMWTIFGISVIVLLFLDLCVFNRKNEEPHFWHTEFPVFYRLSFGKKLVFG